MQEIVHFVYLDSAINVIYAPRDKKNVFRVCFNWLTRRTRVKGTCRWLQRYQCMLDMSGLKCSCGIVSSSWMHSIEFRGSRWRVDSMSYCLIVFVNIIGGFGEGGLIPMNITPRIRYEMGMFLALKYSPSIKDLLGLWKNIKSISFNLGEMEICKHIRMFSTKRDQSPRTLAFNMAPLFVVNVQQTEWAKFRSKTRGTILITFNMI